MPRHQVVHTYSITHIIHRKNQFHVSNYCNCPVCTLAARLGDECHIGGIHSHSTGSRHHHRPASRDPRSSRHLVGSEDPSRVAKAKTIGGAGRGSKICPFVSLLPAAADHLASRHRFSQRAFSIKTPRLPPRPPHLCVSLKQADFSSGKLNVFLRSDDTLVVSSSSLRIKTGRFLKARLCLWRAFAKKRLSLPHPCAQIL